MVGARMVNVFRSTWWMVTWSVLFVMWGGMFPSNPAAEPGKALFTNVLAGVYVVMMGASVAAWLPIVVRRFGR